MNRTDDIDPVTTIPKQSYLKWTLTLLTITLLLFVLILIGIIVAMATATNTAVFGFETFVFVCMLIVFILLGLVTYATKFIYTSKYSKEHNNMMKGSYPYTTTQPKRSSVPTATSETSLMNL